MDKNRLVWVMVVVVILGAIAGFLKLGGQFLERGVDLFGLIFGTLIVFTGIKTNKTDPDKTIKLFNKSVKVGKFLIVGGILIFTFSLIFILFQ
jgi:hypothetical protein